MSFVNDVMAEEADRKGLILFEDYSVLRDVDFTPVQDSDLARGNYWRNFLLVLLILIVAIISVDRLPANHRTDSEPQTPAQSTIPEIQVKIQSDQVIEENEQSTLPAVKEGKSTLTEKPALVDVSVSPAEIKLQETQEQLKNAFIDQTEHHQEPPVHFEKKLITNPVPAGLDDQFLQAQILIQQGDALSAIDVLKQILINDRTYLDARLLLATQLTILGKKDEAIAVYQQGLAVKPDDPRLAQPLAHLLVESGKIDAALLILQKAAPASNDDPEYYSFIASLLQQTGQHKNAIAVYQKILNYQRGNGKWWLGLGISLMAEARNKEALSAFEWSLRDHRVSPALKQFASQRINDLKNRGR